MQIPIMVHIYRGASRVMIWLGSLDEDADLLRRTKSLLRDARACAEVFDTCLTPQATEATRALIASLRLRMSQPPLPPYLPPPSHLLPSYFMFDYN